MIDIELLRQAYYDLYAAIELAENGLEDRVPWVLGNVKEKIEEAVNGSDGTAKLSGKVRG